MRQKNIYFDKMMRLRQKQSKTMRLSDLEQTDVLKERRLRENRDSMEKPILKIQNLNLYFTQYARGLRRRELHPLRDLSCKLFSGELTAVVGASGSGKSLLAHAILGILPYNCRMEGKIFYQGEVLDETRLAGLRGNGISLIPQGVSYLDPLMRVGDQICGGRKDEATRAKCRQLLKRYGLDESVEKCYPFELSGGMARRVLMTAALMQEPRFQAVAHVRECPGGDNAHRIIDVRRFHCLFQINVMNFVKYIWFHLYSFRPQKDLSDLNLIKYPGSLRTSHLPR